MRPGLFGMMLASATCLVGAGPAQGVICYVIYDRSEAVIYQNTYPPMDMSNAGYDQREALRARGEHLTFGDVPKCPTVVFLTGATELRTDEVVAAMPAGGIFGSVTPGSVAGRTGRATTAASPKATTKKTY